MSENNLDIKFALPLLWNHFPLCQIFINFFEQNPDVLRENVKISAVYDNFPYCAWDGGRIFDKYTNASLEHVAEIKEFLNSKNIAMRLIFTNPMIKKEHLSDRFCNLVAQACENPLNEIVVNSPILEDYLREKYPTFNYISSTTKCNIFNDSLDEINLNKYKYICLDYNQNHNFTQLNKLPQNQKNQIEFLCNAICPAGCPTRKEHYRLNGLFYLNFLKPYGMTQCKIKTNSLYPNSNLFINNILPDEINDYFKQGFSMFKIEGRTQPTASVLINCVSYLVKPEYQLWVINEILENLSGLK